MRKSCINLRLVALLSLCFWTHLLNAQNTSGIYEDSEVTVRFDTLKMTELDQAKSYGNFTYHKMIRFCETTFSEGQGLVTKDPFQCYLFICKRRVFSLKRRKAIKGYNVELSDIGEIDKETFEFDKFRSNGHKVLKWRYVYGKTRLDHYLVFGRKMWYLFVSSPYGSNGDIENIIQTIEWK